MIIIFNKKLKVEIQIDETADNIIFTPKHYEEKPYVKIEMKEFNFPHHANSCSNCKKFIDSFGKESVDWYITYFDKKFRLDTKQIGKKGHIQNKIELIMSDNDSRTEMVLLFHQLPTDKTKLETLLDIMVHNEEYENACILRDLIRE